MEAEDAGLLRVWAGRWEDLADFEIVPVLTSQRILGGARHKAVRTKKPVRRTGPVFAWS